MDYDDYATMSDDYVITEDNSNQSIFFSTREMKKDMVIKKANLDWGDMSGDPKDMKHIRKTKPVSDEDYKNHTSKGAVHPPIYRKSRQQLDDTMSSRKSECVGDKCSLKPIKQTVDYTVCPICEQKWVKTCNCDNHDSVCSNNHKWHVINGRVKMGHSHA